jgi:hypothetical protein
MSSIVRRTAVTLAASAAVVTAAAVPASAQPQQDGLINVNVGDVNLLNNVNIGVAAQVAAQICGLKVGPVAVLGTAVDRTGVSRTVCTTDQGPVTLTQN